MIGSSLMDPRKSLKGFTVQDLPEHSKTKQWFPITIMCMWIKYDLESSIGASIILDKDETKADMCSFGIYNPLSPPSSEVASEE